MIYVDDMLIAAKDQTEVKRLKEMLGAEFDMKDLGPAKKILGINIPRNRIGNRSTLSLENYTQKVLTAFEMDQAKAVNTPLGAHFKLSSNKDSEEFGESFKEMVPYSSVGSNKYAMIEIRSDLAYTAKVISRFMSKPERDHWNAVKWVIRYIRGTHKLKLNYVRKSGLKVEVFVILIM